MMTAKVEVRNPTTGQSKDAELLIDTGASISLIDANFVEEMQLESTEGNPVSVTGIGGTRLEKPLTKYSLVHLLTKEGAMDVKLLHIRSPIVSDIGKAQISEDDRKFLSRSAYDKAEMDTSRPPDILLCLSDALPILEGTSVHRLRSGLHLISTKVGDIIAGEQKKHEGCEILTCVGETVPPKLPKEVPKPLKLAEVAGNESAGINPSKDPPTLPQYRVSLDIPDSLLSRPSITVPSEAADRVISSSTIVLAPRTAIRSLKVPGEAIKVVKTNKRRHKKPLDISRKAPDCEGIALVSVTDLKEGRDVAPGSVEDQKPPDIAAEVTPEARKTSNLYISRC